MATEKSKILVIGATGYQVKFIVEASVKAGNPTFALLRKASLCDPVKDNTVQSFKDLGVTILHGDLNDHESLVKAIKQVDVVISIVGHMQILNQTKIISTIKETGNVKRFLPCEFGSDVDRTSAHEPAKSYFAGNVEIRRAVEAKGIPYTYIVNNCSVGFYLRTLVQFQTGLTSPPKDKVTILGDKNAKVEKTHISEERILKSIQVPIDLFKSINHAMVVKGDQTSLTTESSFGVEASELYPDVKYTTIDEYLSQFT